jgi:Pyruvate/2-oxoacid:ferredoxin oxidoreductase delta subunit
MTTHTAGPADSAPFQLSADRPQFDQVPTYDPSLSLTGNPAYHPSGAQRAALAAVGVGALACVVGWASGGAFSGPLLATVLLGLGGGAIAYAWLTYGRGIAGIRHHGTMFSAQQTRGHVGWLWGIVLTGLYVLVYWFPEALSGFVAVFDPISNALGYPEGSRQWVMYGTFYSLAVGAMGVRAYLKYRHIRYQKIRTISVMFFQLAFGYSIPYLLVFLNQPELYFHYFWPLDYDGLWPSTFGWMPLAALAFGAAMIFIGTPVLTYFYGKRWYCSWVCGCGGLAETAGDPYRHLSDKLLRAWKIERWMIHGVLAFIVLATLLLWLSSTTGILAPIAEGFRRWYVFFIGLVFAGVIGVGFYPVFGSRVWCRFGCPMAAILGLQQRFFSRFRITTNGGQCISCGNCSTYCEMGIDVRWYAQRGQNIVRASCVGCGVCSAVCPRGVLSLENGPREGRFGHAQNNLIADLDILDYPGERGLAEQPAARV